MCSGAEELSRHSSSLRLSRDLSGMRLVVMDLLVRSSRIMAIECVLQVLRIRDMVKKE